MKTYLKRTINVCGHKVDVINFGYASFYYPQFNGDAEFKVSSKGFRNLSSYLRTFIWSNNIVKQSCQNLYS